MDVMKRLEALQGCLKAVEDWFRVWSQVPASHSIGLTFAMFIQLVHAIVALLRLSTANDIPAWNSTEVRNRLNLFTLLDGLAEQLELGASALSIMEDDPGDDSSECHPFPKSIYLTTTVCPVYATIRTKIATWACDSLPTPWQDLFQANSAYCSVV